MHVHYTRTCESFACVFATILSDDTGLTGIDYQYITQIGIQTLQIMYVLITP